MRQAIEKHQKIYTQRLRFMDSSDVEQIFIYGFDINDETEALMNRIYKATGNTVIRG